MILFSGRCSISRLPSSSKNRAVSRRRRRSSTCSGVNIVLLLPTHRDANDTVFAYPQLATSFSVCRQIFLASARWVCEPTYRTVPITSTANREPCPRRLMVSGSDSRIRLPGRMNPLASRSASTTSAGAGINEHTACRQAFRRGAAAIASPISLRPPSLI